LFRDTDYVEWLMRNHPEELPVDSNDEVDYFEGEDFYNCSDPYSQWLIQKFSRGGDF